MEIRPINNATDVPQILSLLNSNLKNPGDAKWYEWKHLDSPFGASQGSVAVDNERIVGVILFMRWEFKIGNNIIPSIRLVDSATHPDARGKGLFKTLFSHSQSVLDPGNTLICFSTPNANSLPSLLKAGWGKIEPGFTHCYFFMDIFFKSRKIKLQNNFDQFSFPGFQSSLMETNKSKDFFSWRYKDERYKIASFADNNSSFIVYQLMRIKGIKIFVIKDFYGPAELFKPLVNNAARSCGAFVGHCIEYPTLFSSKGFGKLRRVVTTVVYKVPEVYKKVEWKFAPGDLEGLL